jgi:hypothetical protein
MQNTHLYTFDEISVQVTTGSYFQEQLTVKHRCWNKYLILLMGGAEALCVCVCFKVAKCLEVKYLTESNDL